MAGDMTPTMELILSTLDDLDPTGTIRKGTKGKGEAQAASPSSSHVSATLPPDRVIARARKYLARLPGGVQGSNGSAPTYNAARALVHGFCLDANTALGLLLSDYNPKCDPPWSVRELEHKIADAQNKPFNKEPGWLLKDAREQSRPAVTVTVSATPAAAPADPVGHPPLPEDAGFNPGLPSIVQQPAQLRDVVSQALGALVKANEPMELFVHGDCLTRIDTTIPGGGVKNLSKAQIRLRLSHAANWMHESATKEGDTVRKPTFPKSEVVESIQDHTEWPGLPRLTAIADVPVITDESGLLTKPGFDAASGVYLLTGGYADVPPVADKPSAHDVEVARALLFDDLLVDFPFADDASKANTLAMFLLPFVRGLIDAPTPLHHIDAPQEGTGKSLLIQTWGEVTLGYEPKSLGEVTRPDDWQKLILAALIEAPRTIFLDNLNQNLDSGALASALTSKAIGGRLLGFSRMVSAPVNCVWVSSGNNVSMSRELIRRTLYIRLDARQDAAWKGREFKHKLPKWAKLNRGDLVWACLTLCQAWVAAGKPAGRSLIGGYEAWSAVMDGILCNAGVTDLAGNADAFRAVSVDSGDEWRAFVPAWWREHKSMKVTAGELAQLAEREELLPSVLEHSKTSVGRSCTLAKQLKKVRERQYGDLRIEMAGKNHRDQLLYRIVNLSPQVVESDIEDL